MDAGRSPDAAPGRRIARLCDAPRIARTSVARHAHATMVRGATLDHRPDVQRGSQRRGARSPCRRRRGPRASTPRSIFVDDSTDATPDEIREVAASAPLPVRLIHRDKARRRARRRSARGLRGGRGGRVPGHRRRSAASARGDPRAVATVLARRCRRGGRLALRRRRHGRTASPIARACWCRRRRRRSPARCSRSGCKRCHRPDDRVLPHRPPQSSSRDAPAPRGFKILLEILARKNLRIAEVPFDFADRHAGESKASVRQGLHFLTQLTALRFGKMSLFAVIGGLGAVVNLAIVWALTQLGVDYIVAAIIAAETTIIGNFLLQERFVFHDMRDERIRRLARASRKSFAFNNAEALVRIPIVARHGVEPGTSRPWSRPRSRWCSRSSCASCSTRSSSTRPAKPASSQSRAPPRRRARRAGDGARRAVGRTDAAAPVRRSCPLLSRARRRAHREAPRHGRARRP